MAAEGDTPLVSFGRRLGRHSGVYAAGSIATFVFGMVNVGVLTRLLPIEEFGRLAVYLTIAALLTTLYNLGTLQGVLISVFGVADGDEGMALDDAEGEAVAAIDRERALTTGVLLTVAIATLGTAVMFAVAPLVAGLFGTPGQAEAVRLAALCGATGAVWRLVHNVARLERRPVVYSTLGMVRPVLALATGVGLVVAGFGVEGALAGVAAGTALAIPVAIFVGRHNYALGLELGIVPDVFRRGAFVVPIIAAMWIITNVDLFFVSAYAPADAVGPYRVAMRLGAGVSYLVSAVSMAWLPLRRTPLHTAMSEMHGPSGFGGTLISVFLLFCIWVILGMALLADVLIGIAPAAYADAAPLVPLIGLGTVASGLMLMIYRGAKFPNRRRNYIGLLLAGAAVFVVAGLVLVPLYGGYGAAVAQIIAFAAAAAAMLWIAQRSENPLPIQYGRLGRGIALGLVCIALGQLVSPLAGGGRIFVDLAILAAFPALLFLARAFPSEELRAFVDLSLPSRPRRRSAAVVEKLRRLDPADRRAISVLVANGASPAEAAQALSMPEPLMLSRFVASLREIGAAEDRNGDEGDVGDGGGDGGGGDEGDGSGERDAEVAAYLLSGRGVATRDQLGEQLCEDGADPLDLDVLDTTLGRLRRIPRREWERLAGEPAPGCGGLRVHMTEKPPHRRAWSAANLGNGAAREELLGAIRRAAGPQLRGAGDLLDCGCGNGWLLEALVAAGIAPGRLRAVDSDPARVAAAARRVPGASTIAADARDLPFADEAFDSVFHVVSLSSMGSARSVRAALAESRRVLAPGGVLLVYEPRLPNPLNPRTRLLRRADLEAAGLTVAEARSLTLLPPLGRRLGRLTPALHPLLSGLPPLRSHRLLALRSSNRRRALEDDRSSAGRSRERLRPR